MILEVVFHHLHVRQLWLLNKAITGLYHTLAPTFYIFILPHVPFYCIYVKQISININKSIQLIINNIINPIVTLP